MASERLQKVRFVFYSKVAKVKLFFLNFFYTREIDELVSKIV